MRSAAWLLLLASCTPVPAAPPAERYDVLVRGGLVLDGTGSEAVRADVAVRADTIAAVGDLSEASAALTIDATGRTVAPGFIDLLGNSQSSVLIDPRLEGKLRQGVTTEVTGEGHSPAPIDEAMAAEMERTKPPGWPAVGWRSLREFGDVVEKKGSTLNFAFFVGAANPREMVLGQAERAPDAAELARMVGIVKQARAEGAVGLASALIYPPGAFARREELVAMARVAGSYWTHLRNEADAIDPALDEAFAIARDAGVPLNVFHLKVGGARRGHMAAVVARIETARTAGLDVASCVYPYTATSTALTSLVPAWALEGGYERFRERLRDPAQRVRVVSALREGRAGRSPSTLLVRGAGVPSGAERLDVVAQAMKVDAAEAAARLFEAGPRSPVVVSFSLAEGDMELALQQPWVALCSDSGAVPESQRDEGAHPRAYGTFARVLGVYVREKHMLTLREAVRKMTSLPAARAGLADRGTLRPGMKADIVVFDPERVRDVSTYEDPHHFAEGVRDVLVNGRAVLRDGVLTAERPGRVLR